MRIDGRGREDYRPMELETNVVSHAFGSARLRLANTDILVAVKIEVDVPFPEKPREGKLEFFVDWYVGGSAANYCFCSELNIAARQMPLRNLKAEVVMI